VNATPSPSPHHIYNLERAILRAICHPSLRDDLREIARARLVSYKWQAEDHRIIFAAVSSIRNTKTASLREQLPACATRMGFPDIDWEFLSGAEEPMAGIAQLIDELQAARHR
jgi:hypothetical protein